MPPVISFVVGLTTTAPRPVAADAVGGFSCAPLNDAERTIVAGAGGGGGVSSSPPPHETVAKTVEEANRPSKTLRTFIAISF
jgi:hypothetical protein